MAVVTILRGLPASGKSTWAKQQVDETGCKRVNKDDLRAMLDNSKHSKGRENFVLNLRDSIIKTCLSQNQNIIVDDTNLNPIHQHRIEELVAFANDTAGTKHRVEYKDFTDVPLDECIYRDARREKSVGEKVIRSMYNDWLAPKPVVFPFDPFLPNAIICDLDGTLAHLNGRNPYNASTCENDGINPVVLETLNRFRNDHKIILVSGRSAAYMVETMRWLEKHNVHYDALRMRKDKDSRKDAVVKQEILDNEIRGKYNVFFVLDDRNQVVEMWRANGIPCLQVAPGDF